MATPLKAEEWDQLLGTSNGSDIVRLLTPFYEEPPRLAPPLPALEEQLGRALWETGEYPARIAVLSVSEVERGVEALRRVLPPPLGEQIEESLMDGLKDELKTSLWAELRLCAASAGVVVGCFGDRTSGPFQSRPRGSFRLMSAGAGC